MNSQTLGKICAYTLGIILLCSSVAQAQKIYNPTKQQEYNPKLILKELSQANVVYLGEIHDQVEDHKAQLEIIQNIYQKRGKIAIALEMFQLPYQQVLDEYLAGKITESELIEQSEYKKRWGFPFEYYAPILRFAKQNKIPVLAINTPKEITRQVAKNGLDSLTLEQQIYIPPKSEIKTDNLAYKKLIEDVFKQHLQGGHNQSINIERFFLSQVLWDETMAETIAEFIKVNPDYQVIVLAGQGHIIYGYGIPSRVQRRLGDKIKQKSILLNPDTDSQVNNIADYLWFSVISNQ
ncbi:MAG TPA: ChaN family lipoprotein [Allocoleopsis sp.]